jgi:ferredoxin
MGVLDANPPLPEFRDDYVLQEVDRDWLSKAVKPKQFIHIDQSECIMCEGCVDICPWKCIHMVQTGAIDEAIGTEQPGDDPADQVIFTMTMFVRDVLYVLIVVQQASSSWEKSKIHLPMVICTNECQVTATAME